MIPAMKRGVPCNENMFFPVRITTQGKPCSGPVLALYGIAVLLRPKICTIAQKLLGTPITLEVYGYAETSRDRMNISPKTLRGSP